MKKLFWSLVLLFAFAAPVMAQNNCSLGATPQCTDDANITVSGQSVPIHSNGGLVPSFEYVINGSPATISVVIQGCGALNTCETLDTYTTVANVIRNPTVSKPYDHYKVTASWTGGTNVSVHVVTKITTATLYNSSSGTVNSVGLSMPTGFSVASSPITNNGTLAVTYSPEAANVIQAGPASGSATIPTWRSMVLADLPNQTANTVLGATSTGPPVDLPLPSCNLATSALQYTPGTGFNCATISTTPTGTAGGNVLAGSYPNPTFAPKVSTNVVAIGAVGDGVTNNQTVLQAAIDAAVASGGGSFYFPPGTYVVNTLTLHSGTSIICDNPYSTTILQAATYGGNVLQGDTLGYPGLYSTITSPYQQTYGSGNANGTNGVTIRNCGINGNAYNSTTNTENKSGAGPYHGVEIYGACFIADGNIITNTKGDAVRWESNGTYPYFSYPLCDHGTFFRNNWLSHAGLHYGTGSTVLTTTATWSTTSTTLTVASAAGLSAGTSYLVTGTGIPANTEVVNYSGGGSLSIPINTYPTSGTGGTVVFHGVTTVVDYMGFGLHVLQSFDSMISGNTFFQNAAGNLISGGSHFSGDNHIWGTNQYSLTAATSGHPYGPVPGIVFEAQPLELPESEGAGMPNSYLVQTTGTGTSGVASITVAATSSTFSVRGVSQTYDIVPGMAVDCTTGVTHGTIVASTYTFGSTTVPLSITNAAAVTGTCNFYWPTPQVAILTTSATASQIAWVFGSTSSVQSGYGQSGIQIGQIAGGWAYPGTVSQVTPGNLTPGETDALNVQGGHERLTNIFAQNMFNGGLYLANDAGGGSIYSQTFDDHLATNAASTTGQTGNQAASSDIVAQNLYGPTCLTVVYYQNCSYTSSQVTLPGGGYIQSTRVNEVDLGGPVRFTGNAYGTQSCGATGCSISISNSGLDVAFVELTLSANSTGAVVPVGTSSSMRTRQLIINNANTSGYSLTMDVFANSHVYNGTSCVIAAGTSKTLYWDNTGWSC